MNREDVKIGEEFSENGILYRKTPDGIIRIGETKKVEPDIVIERQIING